MSPHAPNPASHGLSSPEAHRFFENGVHVVEEVTIQRPAPELFAFWRRLSNLPRFMSHVDQVVELDENHSHWKVQGPAGVWEWVAEIINEVPGEVLAWKTVEDSHPANAGSVRFRPGLDGRGTVVRVTLEYIPPAGKLGVAAAKLLGDDPATTLRNDLREFKQLMEAGERPTVMGQPAARQAAEGAT
jgi:uncharacterized membrane protein